MTSARAEQHEPAATKVYLPDSHQHPIGCVLRPIAASLANLYITDKLNALQGLADPNEREYLRKDFRFWLVAGSLILAAPFLRQYIHDVNHPEGCYNPYVFDGIVEDMQ